MKNPTKESTVKGSGDLVRHEMWRIKNELSTARDHDVHRLFAEARKRQKGSAHRVVSFQGERPNS